MMLLILSVYSFMYTYIMLPLHHYTVPSIAGFAAAGSYHGSGVYLLQWDFHAKLSNFTPVSSYEQLIFNVYEY